MEQKLNPTGLEVANLKAMTLPIKRINLQNKTQSRYDVKVQKTLYPNGVVKYYDVRTYNQKGQLISIDQRYYNQSQHVAFRKQTYFHKNGKLKKVITNQNYNHYFTSIDKMSWTCNLVNITNYDKKGRPLLTRQIDFDYQNTSQSYLENNTTITTLFLNKGKIKKGCQRSETRIFRDGRGWNSTTYRYLNRLQYEIDTYKRYDLNNLLIQSTTYQNNEPLIDTKFKEQKVVSKINYLTNHQEILE